MLVGEGGLSVAAQDDPVMGVVPLHSTNALVLNEVTKRSHLSMYAVGQHGQSNKKCIQSSSGSL